MFPILGDIPSSMGGSPPHIKGTMTGGHPHKGDYPQESQEGPHPHTVSETISREFVSLRLQKVWVTEVHASNMKGGHVANCWGSNVFMVNGKWRAGGRQGEHGSGC
jgi:hypothetical protein